MFKKTGAGRKLNFQANIVSSLTALLSCPLLLLSFKNVPISLQSNCIPEKLALGQASEDFLKKATLAAFQKTYNNYIQFVLV